MVQRLSEAGHSLKCPGGGDEYGADSDDLAVLKVCRRCQVSSARVVWLSIQYMQASRMEGTSDSRASLPCSMSFAWPGANFWATILGSRVGESLYFLI